MHFEWKKLLTMNIIYSIAKKIVDSNEKNTKYFVRFVILLQRANAKLITTHDAPSEGSRLCRQLTRVSEQCRRFNLSSFRILVSVVSAL